MKKAFAAVFVFAIGVLMPSIAMGADCHPACGHGQVCCVMQYSNGTYSSPYCRNGNSCYTTWSKKSLQDAKELDATKFDLDKMTQANAKAVAKSAEKSKSKQ